MKNLRQKFTVPMYGSSVLLSVSDSVRKARARENNFLGKFDRTDADDDTDWYGLSCWLPGTTNFGIFFNHDISHGIIAHEIFHLTHRILDGAEAKFRINNHEPFAYLCQFLSDQVYRILHTKKIKVPST